MAGEIEERRWVAQLAWDHDKQFHSKRLVKQNQWYTVPVVPHKAVAEV